MLGTLRSRPPGRPFGFRWNFDKPGEGARRGSGDPPHQFYAEVGKVCGIRLPTCPTKFVCEEKCRGAQRNKDWI